MAKVIRALADIARSARHRDYLEGIASSGLRYQQAMMSRTANVLDVYPDLAKLVVPMGDIRLTRWNMDPLEVFIVSALVMAKRPKRIFEFGTFEGETTVRLARVAPDAEIVTLDLPEQQARTYVESFGTAEPFSGVGAAYIAAGLGGRITQLREDSNTLDVASLGTFDFIIVDAAHDYDSVMVDSRNALRMLAPGGTIVWDDFNELWPGVKRAVREATAEVGADVVAIDDTGLAVCDSSK